jgi:hypothetical protein
MASSVSSERAFSAAGITISKRRNRLKGDVVEALQCLKCMFHNDIIFRDIPISEELEVELDSIAAQAVGEERDTVETVQEATKFSWDELLADSDENESENDL